MKLPWMFWAAIVFVGIGTGLIFTLIKHSLFFYTVAIIVLFLHFYAYMAMVLVESWFNSRNYNHYQEKQISYLLGVRND